MYMAPALQAILATTMVCQYSGVSGLFAQQVPLAVPLGTSLRDTLPGSG